MFLRIRGLKIRRSETCWKQPVGVPILFHALDAEGKAKAPDLRKGAYENDKNYFFISFMNLNPYVFFYDSASWPDPYTIPGKFEAAASKLYQRLKRGHGKLSADELRRFAVWIDSNCLFHGHDADITRHRLMAR